jgi:prephenate dehydrogenase
MKGHSMKKSLGLIGFGNFGKFVHKHLAPWFKIRVYDPAAGRHDLEGALASEIIVLSIPAGSMEDFLRKIRGRINPQSLVVDVSSVKALPVRLMKKYLSNPLLGTHPLFGPESGKNGIKGFPVVFCPARISHEQEQKVRVFLEKKLRLRVISMTPEKHDREMAYVQGISHFIAKGLEGMKMPVFRESTKSFARLMEMKEILAKTTFALFETIENRNPYASAVRRRFLSELMKLERKLEGINHRGHRVHRVKSNDKQQ